MIDVKGVPYQEKPLEVALKGFFVESSECQMG